MKKLTKKEISHTKKIQDATKEVIEKIVKMPAETKKLLNLFSQANGKPKIDFKVFIKSLKALEKACKKIIKEESKK